MRQNQKSKYDLLGSFKLLLLQLEAYDVFADKTLATEETACGARLPLSNRRKATFLLFFSVCNLLCVYTQCTLPCVCVCVRALMYKMSHQCWTRGLLPLSQRLFLSHSFTWLLQAWLPRSLTLSFSLTLSLSSLPSSKAEPDVVLSRSREMER